MLRSSFCRRWFQDARQLQHADPPGQPAHRLLRRVGGARGGRGGWVGGWAGPVGNVRPTMPPLRCSAVYAHALHADGAAVALLLSVAAAAAHASYCCTHLHAAALAAAATLASFGRTPSTPRAPSHPCLRSTSPGCAHCSSAATSWAWVECPRGCRRSLGWRAWTCPATF